MQRVSNRLSYVAFAAFALAGCTDSASRTDLNPAGPPMVRQVRMFEKYLDDGTPPVERTRRVFAFGTHELADESELASTRPAGMVTSAAALNGASVNPFRVIMDELLVGNYLEEIACRGVVDGDALARVPLGATPEDIARCAGPDDTLPRTCPASNKNSVCICQNMGGCLVGSKMIEMGKPVGVLDIDQDGAADETRMINGAVGIKCGASGNITVPLDLDLSYWNPSGDQNRPAQGGFEALGPAIVVTPSAALPTNVECQLTFSDGNEPDTSNPGQMLPAVVDKQNIKVCAPPNGDVTQNCTPGDTSAFKFKVEPLKITPQVFGDGATQVPTNIGMGGNPIDFQANVPLAAASITGITISPDVAGKTITIVGAGLNARTVRISGPAGTNLQANTNYTITIPTTVTDGYNQALPTALVIHFMTGT